MSKMQVERLSAVHSFPQPRKRKLKAPPQKYHGGSIESYTFPDGIQSFENQVAGHSFKNGTVGLLKLNDELVLKPVKKQFCDDREIRFYEQLQYTTDPVLKQLKTFIPSYHGTKIVTINGTKVQCIALENIINGVEEPCIMDLKIGARTWDPLATDKKIQQEKSKYADSKRDMGFCIPGFQVRDLSTGDLRKFGKDYGKQLNGDSVKSALKLFLNADSVAYRPLLVHFLALLKQIRTWHLAQRQCLFYSSSLLFVYDAQLIRRFDNRVANIEFDLQRLVKLKMIDFAHVFPNTENIVDSNYLHGLEHLIHLFEYLLQET